MAYQTLVEAPLPEWIVDMMGEEYQLHIFSEDPSMDLGGIDGFLIYGHIHVDVDFMDRMPRLKVISNFGVGVDHIDLAAAQERRIPVGYTPDLLNGATADMSFALILATARNLIIGDRFARSDAFTHYDPTILMGYDVHSTTLGIIGLGRIGYQVARRARAFDMEVLYHNRNPNPRAEADLGAEYVSLDELLQRSDFVSLTTPLTDETRGLIGRRELGLMKKTAILVNVARGGVVDHDALVEALQSGQIAAAGLDVTEPEPLPRHHPLLQLNNVVIIPHLGSCTRQTRRAMAQRTIDNLRAGLEGRELPNRIA